MNRSQNSLFHRLRRPLRPLALAAGLALPLAPAMAPAQVNLPALGESSSEDFGLSAEKRLGEQIMRDIRRDPDFLDDPMLLAYLQSLWQPLVAAARARGDIGADTGRLFPFEAFLVRDRSVNAFALPGGYVGVHLGLMAVTASRDELASVLAHELSHVTQRHIARGIAAQQRNSTLGMAAMILGMLVASRSNNADVAQAAVVGGQAAMLQTQLNFSRDMEREADRTGFALLAQAGYSAAGMSAMFEKLELANRLNDSGNYPYLRSHPLTIDRIAEARARAAQGTVMTGPNTPTIEHTLMQARARVLMDPSVQALRRLAVPDAVGTLPWAERLGTLYGSALAASQLREFARAEAALGQALALLAAGPRIDPRAQRALALLGAQLAVAQDDGQRAARLLVPMADETTRELLMLRAQAALAKGADLAALRPAAEALQTWAVENTTDASAWRVLAQCAERLGHKLRAVRAEAEAHAAIGDLQGAIDRFRAGQRLARDGRSTAPDFIESSVIDARLRELVALRRQEMIEARGGRGGKEAEKPE
jgi:beta-barrel assembly-enhancing protease